MLYILVLIGDVIRCIWRWSTVIEWGPYYGLHCINAVVMLVCRCSASNAQMPFLYDIISTVCLSTVQLKITLVHTHKFTLSCVVVAFFFSPTFACASLCCALNLEFHLATSKQKYSSFCPLSFVFTPELNLRRNLRQ